MQSTISIDSAGRLILPKAMRDRFKLSGGSKINVEMIGDHLELRPVSEGEETPLVSKNGILVVPTTGKKCNALDAINADREDREADILN